MTNSRFWKIVNIVGIGLIFAIAYFLIYKQAVGAIPSDTWQHIAFMDQFFQGKLYIPHPIWHIGTYYLSHLLHVNFQVAAALFTAFLITLYTIIIYKIVQSINQYEDNAMMPFLITFFSLIVGPFFVMGFNPQIYLGQGSPSVWHNVTLLTVQPFALLSVFFTIRFFETERLNYFILALLISGISIFAKPSYIIIYLPALAVYMLLKKYFNQLQLKFSLIMLFVSVVILGYQFTHEFSGGGVIFDFLGVWSHQTPNVAISILLALGLPLLITLFNYESVKKNEYIKFSWLLVLFSLVLFSCFAEEGGRYHQSNFGWSYNISLSLIYIFTIAEYFKQYTVMPGTVRYPLLAIILYQVYVGAYYLAGMFNGLSYRAEVTAFPFF